MKKHKNKKIMQKQFANWRDWTMVNSYENINFAVGIIEVCETIRKKYIGKRSIG